MPLLSSYQRDAIRGANRLGLYPGGGSALLPAAAAFRQRVPPGTQMMANRNRMAGLVNRRPAANPYQQALQQQLAFIHALRSPYPMF